MSGTGIGRSAGRQRRLAAAQRAYGTLPPAQRRVLVLRYVDDLSTATIAAVLDMPEAEVESLLAEARTDLLGAPRPYSLRPVGAAAAVAAFALTLLPHVVPDAPAPAQARGALPNGVTRVVGGEAYVPVPVAVDVPVPASETRVVRVVTTVPRAAVEPVVTTPRTPPSRPPSCGSVCLPSAPKHGDSLRVKMPSAVGEAVGRQELAVEQEYLPVCGAVPAAPAGLAQCVPGSTDVAA